MTFRVIFFSGCIVLFLPFCHLKRLSRAELEAIRSNTVLPKIDLIDIENFVSRETMAVIFFYKSVYDADYIMWLEKALPIIKPTPIGIVNCASAVNLEAKKDCYDLGLKSPSVRVYRYGYALGEYVGEENARDFVEYIRKRTPNVLVRLDELETFDNFLKSTNTTSVIGFFERESDLEEIFIKVAKVFCGVTFGYSSGAKVLDKVGYSDDIVLYRPKILHNDFEEDFTRYTGEVDTTALKEFIKKHRHGLVGIRDYFNIYEFPKPQIIAYYDIEQFFHKWRNIILPIAKEYPNITFAISQKSDFIDDIIDFGLEPARSKRSQILILAQTEKNHKYILDEFKTEDHLRDFACGLEARKLAQFVKTEDLHNSRPFSESSSIIIAVGSNFLDLVNKNNKDMLIMLFNFNCGESFTSFKFTTNEFKREQETMGFIVMNARANDPSIPFYFVTCPTFFFAGRGFKNKPVLFGGSLNSDKLERFIKEQRRLHQEMRRQLFSYEEY